MACLRERLRPAALSSGCAPPASSTGRLIARDKAETTEVKAIISCGLKATAAWSHLADDFAIAPGAKPRLPRGVRLTHSEAQGGWVLLAPERIFKADAIAFEILRRCTGEATFDALVDDLARTFDAPRERIHADVTKLLASLAEKKLLEL